jgi:phosphoglycolate phosphatase-like HAD superfamily hydrolase
MTHPKTVSGLVPKIRAIFFDLHHTITKTRIGFPELTREAANTASIDLTHISDDQLKEATAKTNRWIADYQIKNDVDIHWGTEPEQWLGANRVFLKNLALEGFSDQTLVDFERAWKSITKSNWESLVEGAFDVLKELHQRGYVLGICTRRHDDPAILLNRWGISGLMSAVLWTAVPGFAKPSPYTLIQAAHKTGTNPKLCAYVGNMVNADVGAARNAEMLPILTIWANPYEREKAMDDTIVIDTLHELLDIFHSPPT